MHAIESVRVERGEVWLICSCGWESDHGPDEEGEVAQRRAWAEHAGQEPEDFGPHAEEAS